MIQVVSPHRTGMSTRIFVISMVVIQFIKLARFYMQSSLPPSAIQKAFMLLLIFLC